MNFPLSLTRFSFHHFPSANITLASYFHFERMSKKGSRKKDDGFSLEYFKRNATGSCKEERMLKSESDGVKKRIEREGKKMEKRGKNWGTGNLVRIEIRIQIHKLASTHDLLTGIYNYFSVRRKNRRERKRRKKKERNSERVPFYQSLSFTLWSLFFQTLIFPKRRKSQ